ncbi:hypothetical protein GF322_05290 [Candidatus Dependentiae bacterium]|nr:hypothetical protein [Candidatus Dependentiae bacterium]
MKKLFLGIVLLSSVVGTNVFAMYESNKLTDTFGKASAHIKKHKYFYGISSAVMLVAGGVITYDVLRNDAKLLKKAKLITKENYLRLKKISKKHPKIAAVLITLLAAGAVVGGDCCWNGKESYAKKGLNKVKGILKSDNNNPKPNGDNNPKNHTYHNRLNPTNTFNCNNSQGTHYYHNPNDDDDSDNDDGQND